MNRTLGLLMMLVSSVLQAATVQRLRCEHLVDPTGIDTLRPRLNWQIDSDRRGEMQSAYRVIVVGDDGKIVWDSGKVASDAMQAVCDLKEPAAAQRFTWKVRVWDRDDKPSDFSQPACFAMGLLTPQDWHGKWVGGEDKSGGPAPMLRKTFELKGAVKRARAYVCGLGYCELRLNGEKVGDRVLDPGYTNFAKRVLYSTFDVTKQLKPGKNAIGAILGSGWYDVHTVAEWRFHEAPWRDRPKLLLEMRVEYEDGTTDLIASDESWKQSTGPITFDSIYCGENYDARLEKRGWDAAGYDDSAWGAARLAKPPSGSLVSQRMPPIKFHETIAPRSVNEPKPGVFIFDMGQNFAGVPQITATGSAGTTVKMRCGERLKDDGTLETSQIDEFVKKYANEQFQEDRYTFKGDGIETCHPRFTYHGFQYVEVTGFPGKPTLENLRGLVLHTALESVGTFECSNPLLNKIHEAGRWSYLSNAHSIPTDCPTREKNGWTGDAHLAAEPGLFNFDGITFYEKWIKDISDCQTAAGDVPAIVPTGGWGYGVGPAWDSAYVLIPWYLYEFYGDSRALEDHYEGMRRYVEYLGTKATDNIVTYGLGDWSPYEAKTPEPLTSTAYYFRDVTIVAEAAKSLGKTADAEKYSTLAAGIRKSFNQKFFNAADGTYANGTQTALSCALYQGLVDPPNRARVVQNLVVAIEKRDNHLDAGILGAKYVMNALIDAGRVDVGYKIASQTTMPSWGWWIKEKGATTLYESWRDVDSRNHIMFGDVLAFFTKAIAGIQPDPASPGFKHIIIKPGVVGDLTSARGEYDSIRGKIASDWRIHDDVLELNVTIPANTTAAVHIPTTDAAAVREGDKTAADANGVKFTTMEGGSAVFEIGSGSYHFSARR